MKNTKEAQTFNFFLVKLILLPLLIYGCATGPQVPYTPPTFTIITIPTGADISIHGDYVGVSPVSIPMPSVTLENDYRRWVVEGRANAPLQIEAQLKGYETKNVSYGVFHAAEDEVERSIVYGSASKTKPGYYTFSNQITIKLSPK